MASGRSASSWCWLLLLLLLLRRLLLLLLLLRLRLLLPPLLPVLLLPVGTKGTGPSIGTAALAATAATASTRRPRPRCQRCNVLLEKVLLLSYQHGGLCFLLGEEAMRRPARIDGLARDLLVSSRRG